MIGSDKDSIVDELQIVDKMTENVIYKAESCEHLRSYLNDKFSYRLKKCEQEPTFLFINLESNEELVYSLPNISASSLITFLTTSRLQYPSPFSQELFSSLAKNRIPFLAIFLEEYHDADLDSWLLEV